MAPSKGQSFTNQGHLTPCKYQEANLSQNATKSPYGFMVSADNVSIMTHFLESKLYLYSVNYKVR